MYHIIVNTAAGSGKPTEYIPHIRRFMDEHGIEYAVWETEKQMDARCLAEKACAGKCSAVVCVGGDGTIHEAASGMAYSGVPLGIIPAGSGNDLIRSLGIKKNTPLTQLLEAIHTGRTIDIDMIRIGQYCFMNIGSVGLDAEIVETAHKLKKRFKNSSYLLATAKNALTFDNFPMRIEIDGIVKEGKFTLMAACNGRYYGGGFKIAPCAKVDDGLITLCLIGDLPKAVKFALFPTVLFGAHAFIKGVEFCQCRKAVAYFDGAKIVNLDGNIYRMDSPLEFEIMPRAAKVIIP